MLLSMVNMANIFFLNDSCLHQDLPKHFLFEIACFPSDTMSWDWEYGNGGYGSHGSYDSYGSRWHPWHSWHYWDSWRSPQSHTTWPEAVASSGCVPQDANGVPKEEAFGSDNVEHVELRDWLESIHPTLKVYLPMLEDNYDTLRQILRLYVEGGKQLDPLFFEDNHIVNVEHQRLFSYMLDQRNELLNNKSFFVLGRGGTKKKRVWKKTYQRSYIFNIIQYLYSLPFVILWEAISFARVFTVATHQGDWFATRSVHPTLAPRDGSQPEVVVAEDPWLNRDPWSAAVEMERSVEPEAEIREIERSEKSPSKNWMGCKDWTEKDWNEWNDWKDWNWTAWTEKDWKDWNDWKWSDWNSWSWRSWTWNYRNYGWVRKRWKKHYIWLLLCWKTSVWKWSLGGDKLEEKWPGLSFVAHWGRGDMLDHVGRNNEKVGIHFSSRVRKRNSFTTTGSIWQENEPSWRSIQEDLPRCVGKAKCFGKMFWPSILWDVGHQLASKAAPEYGERVSFAVAVGDVGSGNPIGENGGGTWCLTLTVHT